MDEKESPAVVNLASQLTPATYQQLRTALELGKWEDGRKLTVEQKESSLQLIIAYDEIHTEEEQRVGYVAKPKKKQPCASDDKERPVKFR